MNGLWSRTAKNEKVSDTKHFNQLCVWAGVVLPVAFTPKEFEMFFQKQGFRVKFAEEVITLPDMKNGKAVEGTGGRHDVLFYVHDDDIDSFILPRLQFRIRWWSGATYYISGSELYPTTVINKYSR